MFLSLPGERDTPSKYFASRCVLFSLVLFYFVYAVAMLASHLDSCVNALEMKVSSGAILVAILLVCLAYFWNSRKQKIQLSLTFAVSSFWLFNFIVFLLIAIPTTHSESACSSNNCTSPHVRRTNARGSPAFLDAMDIPLSAVAATTPFLLNEILPFYLTMAVSSRFCSCLRSTWRPHLIILLYFSIVVSLLFGTEFFNSRKSRCPLFQSEATTAFAALVPQATNFGLTYVPNQENFPPNILLNLARSLGKVLVLVTGIVLGLEASHSPDSELPRMFFTTLFSAILGFITQITIKEDMPTVGTAAPHQTGPSDDPGASRVGFHGDSASSGDLTNDTSNDGLGARAHSGHPQNSDGNVGHDEEELSNPTSDIGGVSSPSNEASTNTNDANNEGDGPTTDPGVEPDQKSTEGLGQGAEELNDPTTMVGSSNEASSSMGAQDDGDRQITDVGDGTGAYQTNSPPYPVNREGTVHLDPAEERVIFMNPPNLPANVVRRRRTVHEQ